MQTPSTLTVAQRQALLPRLCCLPDILSYVVQYLKTPYNNALLTRVAVVSKQCYQGVQSWYLCNIPKCIVADHYPQCSLALLYYLTHAWIKSRLSLRPTLVCTLIHKSTGRSSIPEISRRTRDGREVTGNCEGDIFAYRNSTWSTKFRCQIMSYVPIFILLHYLTYRECSCCNKYEHMSVMFIIIIENGLVCNLLGVPPVYASSTLVVVSASSRV